MKKILLLAALILCLAAPSWAADQKISELDAITDLTADDLFVVVDNPAGTPVTKKIVISDAYKMKVVVNADTSSYNVTAAQMAIGTFFLTTNAATTTYNLPAAAAGYQACFRMGQGNAQVLRIDTDGTDYIVMPTGARTSAAGDYYGATSSASNQICVVAFNDTDYYVTSYIGTWSEE